VNKQLPGLDLLHFVKYLMQDKMPEHFSNLFGKLRNIVTFDVLTHFTQCTCATAPLLILQAS